MRMWIHIKIYIRVIFMEYHLNFWIPKAFNLTKLSESLSFLGNCLAKAAHDDIVTTTHTTFKAILNPSTKRWHFVKVPNVGHRTPRGRKNGNSTNRLLCQMELGQKNRMTSEKKIVSISMEKLLQCFKTFTKCRPWILGVPTAPLWNLRDPAKAFTPVRHSGKGRTATPTSQQTKLPHLLVGSGKKNFSHFLSYYVELELRS